MYTRAIGISHVSRLYTYIGYDLSLVTKLSVLSSSNIHAYRHFSVNMAVCMIWFFFSLD